MAERQILKNIKTKYIDGTESGIYLIGANAENVSYVDNKVQSNVKEALNKRYIKPNDGIPTNDLSQSVQDSINEKYKKPNSGIPTSDLSEEVQNSINEKYIKPTNGIPKSHLSEEVQTFLGKADGAIQKTAIATTHENNNNKVLSAALGYQLNQSIIAINSTLHSDETTLDTLQEIVDYIQSNKSLIDNITTNKVNVADIIDNLTTTAANKPLSANQGNILDGKIASLTTETNTKITNLETETNQKITDLETTTNQKITNLTSGTDERITDLEGVVNKKYVKPSTGIPEADLSQDVKNKIAAYTLSGSDATVKLTQNGVSKGSYTVDNVAHAGSATNDGSGNNIVNTYDTKVDAQSYLTNISINATSDLVTTAKSGSKSTITIPEATTTQKGYMSAASFNKLAGIQAGAQVNKVNSVKGNLSSNAHTGDITLNLINDFGGIPSSEKGAANGVVPLNSNKIIDSKYLPSYIDDVIEKNSFSDFPAQGETSKIYVALDTNLTYRWSGSTYIEISKDTNTTYELKQNTSNGYITLQGSDGSSQSVLGGVLTGYNYYDFTLVAANWVNEDSKFRQAILCNELIAGCAVIVLPNGYTQQYNNADITLTYQDKNLIFKASNKPTIDLPVKVLISYSQNLLSSAYNLPMATETALGGIKLGYTKTATTTPLKINSEGQAYVDVSSAISSIEFIAI